ncbi:MAG: nicotinate-nucleotide--dimethylbenzimidazole phosphoribosyltransferase [Desulfuromonas sp.]|nr:MAG: nicotinate-nucleotide--dimethylbenzimidazole phosphoribosyltransferase [Desulfuromonas sp.]
MDISTALDKIKPVNPARLNEVQARIDSQAKPQGSLGRLEELARRFVAITGRDAIRKKVVFTFAGDHGVVAEGVSAFPKEVTPQMVYNFIDGGAAINALARHAEAEVIVVDMGVDHEFESLAGLIDKKIARGTANFTRGPAMSREQAVQALETGIELALYARDAGMDLVGTGDMGIGNTTPSSAILAAFSGLAVEQLTHRGTGIDDEGLQRKIAAIQKGLEVNAPNPDDPIDVLAKVGGFEIAGIAGLIVGCAALGIPVVVDGFISTAGALIASELHPHVKDYLFASHKSVEIGHVHMLDRIGQQPLLDLGLRLGEGTGGALVMSLIEAALQGYRDIRTFDEAGVSDKDQA